MNVSPIWKILGVAPATPAAQIAERLAESYEHGRRGVSGEDLTPYYETFVSGELAGVVQGVYDEFIAAATSEGKTNLNFDHPVVGIAAALAGVAVDPPDQPREESTMPIGGAFQESGNQTDGQVPISFFDRLFLMFSWVALPGLGAIVIGGILYFGEPLVASLSRSFRSTSAVGDRVATVLDDANVDLVDAGEHLAELDAQNARLAGLSQPVWHDTKSETLPAAVRRWLLPPVRTEAARAEQDRLILRYLALVQRRAELAAEVEALRTAFRSVTPDYERGADLGDQFDARAQLAKAKRLAKFSSELRTELTAISSEAAALKDR
jgi:hypothetical protein